MTQYGSTTNGIILEWKLFHLHFNGILDLVKVEVDRFVGKTKSTWIQTIITITIQIIIIIQTIITIIKIMLWYYINKCNWYFKKTSVKDIEMINKITVLPSITPDRQTSNSKTNTGGIIHNRFVLMRLQAKWFGDSECDLKSDISWYYTYYDKNFIDKTININSLYLNDNEFFLRFSNCKNWITNDEYYYNTDVLERYFVFDLIGIK